jgi:hypothetical protein
MHEDQALEYEEAPVDIHIDQSFALFRASDQYLSEEGFAVPVGAGASRTGACPPAATVFAEEGSVFRVGPL